MADYKELIRKAIEALPENNGAARRAVYEKARAALVGQLRGLNPPLAARDITQHRLQLEDCIRQVEQEASEQVIAGLKQNEDYTPPYQQALPPPRAPSRQPPPARQPAIPARNGAAPRPELGNGSQRPAASAHPKANGAAPPRPLAAAPRQTPAAPPPVRAARPAPPAPRVAAEQPQASVAPASRGLATTRQPARPVPTLPRSLRAEPERMAPQDTIEEIIAAADDLEPVEYEDEFIDAQPDIDEPELDDVPEPPMFRLEERRSRKAAAPVHEAPIEAPRAEARQLPAIVARAEAAKAGRSAPRNGLEAPRRANGDGHARPPQARQQSSEPIRLPRPQPETAMQSVREVDLEETSEGDAQVAIERAIATLEREARNDGETSTDEDDFEQPPVNGRRRNGTDVGFREPSAALDGGFARAPVETERGGGSAVTIFLLVFLVLLIGAGGGGYWAWREGFIDFDAMFGKSPAASDQASAPQPAPVAAAPAPSAPVAPATNTETASTTPAQSSQPLTTAPVATPAPAPTPAPAAAAPAAEPSAETGVAPKSEDRLSTADASAAPATPGPATPAPGSVATSGSQSLLLEASQDGTTGAVPFSGTVEWSKGTDEMGQPTLVGKANIPARNLGVNVLIRKNNDPALPASHLMEINFTVNASFAGGAIAGLPGVLLKNEELVQGTPLVGASARVVGNSFLFALSSSAADEATNKDLLTSRKWMDLAIIYATGKKAIITLEKDDKTEQLFNDVFAAWGKTAAAPAPAK